MSRTVFVIALYVMSLAIGRAASPASTEKSLVDTSRRLRPRSDWTLFIIELGEG
jgi:hypothetical protein